MRNNPTTILATLTILSLASLASMPAQAGGGSTSAPSKYNNQFVHQTGQAVAQTSPAVARSAVAITEFSSSSAPIRKSGPKR
jgi:hypothetical protein